MELISLMVIIAATVFTTQEWAVAPNNKSFLLLTLMFAVVAFGAFAFGLPNPPHQKPSYTYELRSDTITTDALTVELPSPAKARVSVWRSWSLLVPDTVHVELLPDSAEQSSATVRIKNRGL